jgi:hypothetical protein
VSKRALKDWLDGYLKYTEDTESPTSYHIWAGLSLIAGALQRKVYLRWGFETIYPNLYIVLIGPSGKARKGAALGIAKDLLMAIPGISVSPEAASPEAIILAMKRASANFTDPTDNKIKFHCSLTAFSEELAVFLGQANIGLLSKLTDFYDSKDSWSYETVGRGRDSLQGLCFNLLGATAPEWIQSMLPQEAVGGGFTSRVIFIVEERKGKTVPKPVFTEANRLLQDDLICDLERVSNLKGKFTFSPAAEEAYVNWYSEQDRLSLAGEPAIADPKFAGYCERRATHIRKLCMLMSASRCDHLVIELCDFDRALKILKAAELKMHMAFRGLGRAKNADITDQVINYIRNMKTTTRKVLMQRFYRDLGPDELKAVEETMESMGVVKVALITQSGDKVYQWIGD